MRKYFDQKVRFYPTKNPGVLLSEPICGQRLSLPAPEIHERTGTAAEEKREETKIAERSAKSRKIRTVFVWKETQRRLQTGKSMKT